MGLGCHVAVAYIHHTGQADRRLSIISFIHSFIHYAAGNQSHRYERPGSHDRIDTFRESIGSLPLSVLDGLNRPTREVTAGRPQTNSKVLVIVWDGSYYGRSKPV